MLETSKDVLLLMIALCVFLFTIFSCWVIYYIATILREVKKIVRDIRKKIELLEGVFKALKEKLERTSSYAKLLIEGGEAVFNFVKAKKTEDKAKKRGRKK